MIFNLFKSKPTLKELIPDGFVDIHSHILPGIDDGAKDIEESILLIEKMKGLGFSKIIATPHTYPGIYDNTNISIKNSHDKISKRIDSDVEVSFASEYMLDKQLIEKAEEKKLLCIKKNYILVEMSYVSPPKYLHDILFKLQINGYAPILAHPERYTYFFENITDFKKLKDLGCEFQLNLLSTTNHYGREISKLTDYLLKNNMYEYVGSDIHNLNHVNKFNNKVRINQLDELIKVMENNSYFRED